MNRARIALLAALLTTLLVAGGSRHAPAAAAAAAADDATAQQVRSQVEATMNAFAAMDAKAFAAGLAEDVVAYEFDLEGKPLRLGSRQEAVRFAEEVFTALGKMGATTSLAFHDTDCEAGTTIAWCTVEFDFVAKMADGSAMTQPTRNTVVLRKGEGGWRWAHWHSSPAAAPPSPADAAPAKP